MESVATVHIYLVLMAMLVVFSVLTLTKRVSVPVSLILTAMAGALVGGFGIPMRHLVEGSLLFLYLMLTIATGMIFMGALKESGALGALTRAIIVRFSRHPWIMLPLLMVVIMFPAMLTGSGPAAVLSTGVLVAPILFRMGLSKPETAAIIALGATFGITAPPVNVPAMIICTGVYMPYSGFDLLLLALTLPVAVFTVLYISRAKLRRGAWDAAALLEAAPACDFRVNALIYLPLVVVVALMVGSRMLPNIIPDLGTPLIFMLGAALAIFTGRKFSFIRATKAAMADAVPVLAIFVAVGVLIQVMALTGVRGLLVATSLNLPVALLSVTAAVAGPLLGGPLMPFGVASVLGVPLVLALIGKNTIVVTSAITHLMSLGAMIPPTAISGGFAAHITGETNYISILRKSLVPSLLAIALGILTLIFPEQVARIFSL